MVCPPDRISSSGPAAGEDVVRLRSIAIVGASLAGLRAAEALRREGFDGRLVLIGAEPHLPYDRPPLSKEVLAGTRSPDEIGLTKPDRFDALQLDLRLGCRATTLNLNERTVRVESVAGGAGEDIAFDGLVIATGASPRKLPDTPDLAGIHTLRTLDDCIAIRSELAKGPRVAVVGAGFIGAEVAATCRARGLSVSVIETLDTPLEVALGKQLGGMVGEVHRDHGVDLRCGVRVSGFGGSERVESVLLEDGSRIDADLVVVGIGVEPETQWLESSGLEIDNGVVCDETSAASAPDVVAAGDIARWYNPLFAETMRVEHWTNAVEQAEAAAQRLLNGPDGAEPFAPVPFVWSNQYDMKIQSAGRPRPGDEVHIAHGSIEERRFVALFGREGRLSGAVAFNRVRALMSYRKLLRSGSSWDDALAAASS
jgi:NADPH-dependent 2,4-dienoyl-CoA reductase/sulfur reductase-like enzyme